MNEQRYPVLGTASNFLNKLSSSKLAPFNPMSPSPSGNMYNTKTALNPQSRVMNSDANLNAMIEDTEVFPQELLMLMVEEARNIKNFKNRIDREKQRVVSDMEVFKRQVNHIIDDLKLSMMAELDLVYKAYIQKYATMKSEIMEVRRLKKQVRHNTPVENQLSKLVALQHDASNLQILKEIEEEAMSLRNQKINNYIHELQKKKLTPMQDFAKDLIILTSSPIEFYDSNATNNQLAELKQNFSHFTKHMFNALSQFVRSANLVTDSGKIGEPILNGIEISKVTQGQASHVQPAPIGKKAKKEFSISQSEQIIEVDWAEEIGLKHFNCIQPDHTDSILCGIIISNRFLVTGGKDGLLNVQALEGSKVTTLRGHEAGICTLSLIDDGGNVHLASGSDHGCNSIIIWDINNWSIKAKIKAHTAAVTSIVDLCDGQTLVSGSYDKKINVYNYKKSVLLFSLPNNKSSVTSMLLNSSRNKLISCGFDSMMFVWNIVRDQSGVVQFINIDRVIQNNSIICCLNGSMLRPDIIVAGTKDGKVKFWNINSGELQKTLTVNNNLVIDMVLIERQAKPNFPLIVSCSSKDRSLVLTRSDTQANSIIDVAGRNYIEFGCGISPKIMFTRYNNTPVVGLVNQSPHQRQVNLFELQLR